MTDQCTNDCRNLPLDGMIRDERLWTPVHNSDKAVRGRIYEAYHGLRGQLRIGVVDDAGRVHHFDASQVMPLRVEEAS